MEGFQAEDRQPLQQGGSHPGREAVYLYCIARTQGLPNISGTGIEESRSIVLHPVGEITAVVSNVPVAHFTGSESEGHLQDPAWIGPRAYRHEALIECVMRHSPVLPFPFGTLFTSMQSMEKHLRCHEGTIVRFLRETSDKSEWALKGYVEPDWAQEAAFSRHLAAEEQHLRSLPPGKRYFREKRLREQAKRELSVWVDGMLDRVAERLKPLAAGFRERDVLSRKATGKHMVSNWAYLIDDAVLEVFRKGLEGVNAELHNTGTRFEFSGPWPPYSFSPFLEDAGS